MASRRFEIRRSTIHRHVTRRVFKQGRKCDLNDTEEKRIVKVMLTYADRRITVTLENMRKIIDIKVCARSPAHSLLLNR